MFLSLENWCSLPTPMGNFRMYDSGDDSVRIISFGAIEELGSEPLIRVHSSCIASEVFGALDCDCADQLREAMKLIASEGRGLILHLRQEGRGHGLALKIRAVSTMERRNLDTAEAFEILGLDQDIRSYPQAVNVLKHIGVNTVRLISNNPRKKAYLEERGVSVKTVNTHPSIRPENAEYLRTKNSKLGHCLPLATETDTHSDIQFYHSDQPWGQLSNFSKHSVFIDGRIWPTVEHFYQAQKFSGASIEEIRQCATPTLAKNRAYEFPITSVRTDWLIIRNGIMLQGLRAKFNQHPELRELLLSSGNRRIVEHTKQDAYWGDGGDGSGRNLLGQLLMQVRTELCHEIETQSLVG